MNSCPLTSYFQNFILAFLQRCKGDLKHMNPRTAANAAKTNIANGQFYPGFDLLRIVAAGAVIFSHAFLIADTFEDYEPFQMVTGEIAGVYGVYLFFILSGFLVTDSALRSHSLGQFALKRARRILPAFIVANLVTVLVIGSAFSQEGVRAHLADPAVWTSLFRVLTFQDSRLWMASVSFYSGRSAAQVWLSHSLNAVIWTIRIEMACYVIVGLLFVFGALRKNLSVALVVAGSVYFFQSKLHIPGLGGLAFLFPSFSAGLAMRLHVGNHTPNRRIATLSLIGLIVAMTVIPEWSKLAPVMFPLFACYPLLWFGRFGWHPTSRATGSFDPSYGMYIWGWPIQQLLLTLLYSFGFVGITGPTFALVSIPVVYVVGGISWRVIERPFLRRSQQSSVNT